MVKTGTLTALFHELVRTAMSAQRMTTSETTEHYLVQLLETFARPDRANLFDPPLGLDYLEALRLPPRQRHGRLRRVADTALFVSGVFFDSLERRLVGPHYYATLGSAAYAHLSHDAPRGALADPFEELAGRFPHSSGCSPRSATARSSAGTATIRCGSTSAGYTRAARTKPPS